MAGDFDRRMRDLEDEVGQGSLVGTVLVDQVYAQIQHEALEFRHVGGGKAKYLEDPLVQGHVDMIQHLANNVLSGRLPQAMAGNMEDLAQGVYEQAPLEFGDLKASPHPSVTDNGNTTYDRPAMMTRLTDEELEIKDELREIGLGNRGLLS